MQFKIVNGKKWFIYVLVEVVMISGFDNLAFAQKIIFVNEIKFPEQGINTVSGYARIQGEIVVGLLAECVCHVLNESDIVTNQHTYFQKSNNKYFFKNENIKLQDYVHCADPEQSAIDYMLLDAAVKLTQNDDLISVSIIRCAPDLFFWYVKVHHILFDGYSMALFFNKVSLRYDAIVSGEHSLADTNFTYEEFVRKEKDYRTSSLYAKDRSFWLSKLNTGQRSEIFETGKRISAYEKPDCEREEIIIPRKLFSQVEYFTKKTGCSALHYFLAVLQSLNRCLGNSGFRIGLPVHNRSGVKSKETLGVFISTIPIDISASDTTLFSDLLKLVRKEVAECYRHKQFPVYELQAELGEPKGFFNVLFSYQKNVFSPRLGKADCTIVFLKNQHQLEDLRIHLLEYSEDRDLVLAFDYNTQVFSKEFICDLIKRYFRLLNEMLTAGDLKTGDTAYMETNERKLLLSNSNRTSNHAASNKTVVDLFSESAAKFADKAAIIFKDRTHTYKEIDTRSSRLACYLKKTHHLQAGNLVGIKLNRNEWMVISVLAVLKAACGYVPIDPDLPEYRAEYIRKDSNCQLIIDQAVIDSFSESVSGNNELISEKINGSDLAYVIYTSGTTGMPKGVMITHQNLVSFFPNLTEIFGFRPEDSVAAATNFTFDISVLELLGTLVSGASIYLIPDIYPETILEGIKNKQVTVLQVTPSRLNLLLEADKKLNILKQLKCLLVGGEAMKAEHHKKLLLLKSTRVFNVYGPTETTIWSSCLELNANALLTIGKPLLNEKILICNGNYLAPALVAGEICIGGSGLAKGYLNQESLTAEKFIASPFEKGERLYKTGDTGRLLQDGSIEFLGRRDNQLKINGYRIEPAEIEDALQQFKQIEQAVTVVRNASGKDHLAAFYSSKTEYGTADIVKHLHSILPYYMVPDSLTWLNKIPLTPSGKVDRKLLSEMEIQVNEPDHTPVTDSEKKIIATWKNLLGKEFIAPDTDFFLAGGDSISATRLMIRLQEEFKTEISLKDIFINRTPRKQSKIVLAKPEDPSEQISLAEPAFAYPLSSSQKRLFILQKLVAYSPAYNMTGTYLLSGIKKEEHFISSLNELFKRHEILRTSFTEDGNGEPLQFIQGTDDFIADIKTQDLRNEVEKHTVITAFAEKEKKTPFNLSKPGLLRITLFRIEDEDWVLCYVMHHIISDGWSMEIILRDLTEIYIALNTGSKADLPQFNFQYKDYAVWQKNQIESGKWNTRRNYWISQFTDEISILDLPTDKPRPILKTYKGGIVSKNISKKTVQKFKTQLTANGSTFFTGLIAAVKVLLFKYTNQKDIIIGSPVSTRIHKGLEDQVGFYANTLAFRTIIEPEKTFSELLEKIKDTILNAYTHQDYPFDELINGLSLQRDMSRNPLFDVMVVHQNNNVKRILPANSKKAFEISEYKTPAVDSSKFDLLFEFKETSAALELNLEFNSDIYTLESAQTLAQHFCNLLACIADNDRVAVDELVILEKEEQKYILKNLNPQPVKFSDHKTVIDLFLEQVSRTPGNVALYFEGKEISYDELNKISNRFCRFLLKKNKIRSGDMIAINLNRGEHFIVSVLGILKTGAGYVPIDPSYPDERKELILQDSKSLFAVNDLLYSDFLNSLRSLPDDLPPASKPVADSGLYIIYTSGSTGRPKGIVMPQRAMVNLVEFHLNDGIQQNIKRVMQFASIGFDVSFQEIFTSLSRGATLFPVSDEIRADIFRFISFINDNLIDTLFLPTAYFKLLIEDRYFHENIAKSLKHIFVAGEQLILSDTAISYLSAAGITLHNHYGPAETHVVTAASWHGKAFDHITNYPSIGKPVQNNYIYVLDDKLLPVPNGVTGEICIGGIGLSKGYIGQPEHTNEKFVANPYSPGTLIYRTGDLGKWNKDASLHYVGRKDFQVKIRGYRIEPGEIEAALISHGHVEDAHVVINSEKNILAFFTGNKAIEVKELKNHLTERIPPFMVPDRFFQLPSLPVTTNGKINRKKLLEISEHTPAAQETYVPPRNATDEKLIEIWKEILGKTHIGIRDNFFDLGGHSLKATRLLSRIHKDFNVKLELKDIFT
ncbi:MAG: amino acid adenylation domain-containing protein, partial [Bacteroidia bacterium]|nr:amino acid adenylation domain-containing protein [Bacteroidia bacterium]